MTETVIQQMIEAFDGFALVDHIGCPVATDAGPRCGNHYRGTKTHHNSVAAVKLCYAITAEQVAEVEACAAAEQGYERYLEDRGYWEAQAQDDYEARMGVIPFDVAYAQAMAGR